jgi:predicted DNA-binding transcriptional regulator AlpA
MDELLTARQCAEKLQVGVDTWRRMVRDGRAPKPVVDSHKLQRWSPADLRSAFGGGND